MRGELLGAGQYVITVGFRLTSWTAARYSGSAQTHIVGTFSTCFSVRQKLLRATGRR
jgi:hypothetical protein